MNSGRIYKNFYLSNRKYVNLNNVDYLENVKTSNFTSDVICWPKKVYNEDKVLELIPEKSTVNNAVSICIKVDKQNFERSEVLSLSLNGATSCDLININLFSSDKSVYKLETNFYNDRWTRLLFDISKCNFLDDIVSIELNFISYKKIEISQECIYIAELYFGNIVDYQFEKGVLSNFVFTKGILKKKRESIQFEYKDYDELVFFDIPDSRYSVLNTLLYIKDTIKISCSSLKESLAFKLYFKTTENCEYSEEKSLTFTISSQKIETKLLSLEKYIFSNNERLLGIKIKPLDKEGKVTIYDISFIQEKDFILDDDAKKFMNSKKLSFKNYYNVKIKKKTYNIKDFGAVGDFYTNDTMAIQKAINCASLNGGGIVLVPSGRYIITHLDLRSNIELNIGENAILIQSENPKHYSYDVMYEHDNFYYKSQWAHNFLVHNKPLIYGNNLSNVKITGKGRIRMADTGSEFLMSGWPYYDIHCNSLIHVIPIAFNKCKKLIIKDITINRANSYHMHIVKSCYCVIDNCKLYDPRCLSGDGIAINGSHDFKIINNMIVSNDDGVVLNTSYNDPRSHRGTYWHCTPEKNNSLYNIEVNNCYVNSAYGGWGKAIAFIPWGKSASNQENELIKNIYVHNCILKGGNSVGTWCDDPYHGKQPFDNSELDDYSPIEDITFKNNVYYNSCDLMKMQITNIVSDNNLHSAQTIVNGSFIDGMCNWKCQHKVKIDREKHTVYLNKNNRFYQIIYSTIGINRFNFKLKGKGYIFINNKIKQFESGEEQIVSIECLFRKEKNIKVGVASIEKVEIYNIEKEEK